MCYKSLIFLTLCIATLIFIGCGGDEEIPLGEEVVVDKWIEPEDIGKEYSVKEPALGDTVLLHTGEQYKIREFDVGQDFDSWQLIDGKYFITTVILRPKPDEPNTFIVEDRIQKGYVVPEGPPIVSLHSWELLQALGIEDFNRMKEFPVRSDNNVQQDEQNNSLRYEISIDRALPYHLLVYVEYQLLESPEKGGGVRRGRQLLLIPKGVTLVYGDGLPTDLGSGGEGPFDKISVRVLPYKEMEEIELPYEVFNEGIRHRYHNLGPRDVVVVEGHTYRPYRIHSSSFFLMERIPPESIW